MLGASNVSFDDLKPYVLFKDRPTSVLICSGEQYEMLVVCWKSERSPIRSRALDVLLPRDAGRLHGDRLRFSPCGQVIAGRPAGRLHSRSQDTDTHQVSNLQPAGRDLVTLHIYSPPLQAMRKYSLTGNATGLRRVPVCRAEEEG
jgi:cysteine dioxygenase